MNPLIWLLVSVFAFVKANDVITSNVFDGDAVNGLIAAFGDFDADKLTDVFFITNQGSTVVLYLAQPTPSILVKSDISCKFNGYTITSVVPGDYDGDNKMDILVTLTSAPASKKTFVKILWGNLTTISNCTLNLTELETNPWKDQPVVLDYNADKIPDIYGETFEGQRQVWIMGNRTFKPQNISSVHSQFRKPHSNAFLDLNHDMAADIFVTGIKNAQYVFEIWYNKDGKFDDPTLHEFNVKKVDVLGQSAFADFNVNGKLDHVVPVCYKGSANCTILINHGDKWLPLIAADKVKWRFYYDTTFPITLRIGDFNLDGYPDVLAVVTKMGAGLFGKAINQAVLFENTHCDDEFSSTCLEPKWNYSELSEFSRVVQVAFYDFHQDGSLDFLLVHRLKDEKKFAVEAIKNSFAGDVCFLKVLVVSGLCNENCPKSFFPYGVNQPGPLISYNTTKPNGEKQKSCAAQLSQSAYFSLQLPYTVFGLGQTPNFVDSLGVGLPQSTKKEKHLNTWSFIIPNSQVVIIPLESKRNNYYLWMLKLFVTPSHQVLMTFIALSGTCLLVALLIGGFHWKEKAEDKKEKLQEAHRFHFDAM